MCRSLVPAAVLIAIILGGCGGDDSTSASPTDSPRTAGDTVEVVADDIKFPTDTFEATAGPVDLRYRNEGSIIHTLVIENVDGFKLEVTRNGDEDEGTVELEAGSYTLYCDVAGHREAGMEATLEVT